MAETPLDLYVVVAPGIQLITAAELGILGVTPSRVHRGGVEWRGHMGDLYRANLWLRTATRVLVRAAGFHASSFAELESRAARVPWGRFVRARDRAIFRVTCHKSALYHSDAVAQRLAQAITAATGCLATARATDPDADEPDSSEQLFIVRIEHDMVTLSADSSGVILHKRGYRQATAKAPLRETLAASMLLSSGWKTTDSLIDPMCGSGTIPVEAALIARNIAPGLHREFRFERWPGFNRAAWATMHDEAIAGQKPVAAAPIVAADRDEGAIDATMSNAERAGVGGDIEIVQRPLSESLASRPTGWVLTNPPYGVRIGTDVRNLYATMGSLMRTSLNGWHLGFLSASPELERQVGIPLERMFDTKNGGIPIRFLVG